MHAHLQARGCRTQDASEPEFLQLLESVLVRPAVGQACAAETSHRQEAWWAVGSQAAPPRLGAAGEGQRVVRHQTRSVPRGAFGPRLQAVLSLLAGVGLLGSPIRPKASHRRGISSPIPKIFWFSCGGARKPLHRRASQLHLGMCGLGGLTGVVRP
ncbi:hypothetical protein Pan161_53050 [Gimesia algae]|uniref:Uncharacterized protein n=1 Tax=Gimesia algae TaxID=2527971 RepID=A0A517VKS6_9PLAN|nr:hypothetical protein Pan161_53050 [Gimesia algae]